MRLKVIVGLPRAWSSGPPRRLHRLNAMGRWCDSMVNSLPHYSRSQEAESNFIVLGWNNRIYRNSMTPNGADLGAICPASMGN